MRLRTLFLAATLLGSAACGEAPTTPAPPPAAATLTTFAAAYTAPALTRLLTDGGRFAESSYMACLISYYAQGLGLKQISELCGKLLETQAELGWGSEAPPVLAALARVNGPAGYPTTVTATCAAGDPQRAAGKRPLERGRMLTNDPVHGAKNWGEYTWGAPPGGCDASGCYRGLTEKQSRDEKKAKADAARAAAEAAAAAAADAEANPDDEAKKKAAEEAKKAAEAKAKEAKGDPNKKKEPAKTPAPLVSQGTRDETLCEGIVQSARELLAECHRTNWKRTECQQLEARVHGCPDPTLIFVDPDFGYSCTMAVDSAVLLEAWKRRCEQNVTPGPDGGSPCTKPNPSASGQTVQGNENDICTSPIARTDPENDGCIGELEVHEFGKPDLQGLITWGQGVLGGPIVVIPVPLPRPRLPV